MSRRRVDVEVRSGFQLCGFFLGGNERNAQVPAGPSIETPGLSEGIWTRGEVRTAVGFYTLRLAKKMLCGFVFQLYIGKTGSDESTAAVVGAQRYLGSI